MDILRKKGIVQKILFLLLIIFGLVWLDKSSKKDDETRFLEGDFAIGYIDKYIVGLGKGSNTGFYYHFSYNDKKYHYFNDKGISYSLESWKLPSGDDERKKIKQGDTFLVIFDENGSRLFFKYPISDSVDFKQYIKLIEQQRAKNIKKTP